MKTTFDKIKRGQEFYYGEGVARCRYKKMGKATAAPIEAHWQRYGFKPDSVVETVAV